MFVYAESIRGIDRRSTRPLLRLEAWVADDNDSKANPKILVFTK